MSTTETIEIIVLVGVWINVFIQGIWFYRTKDKH